MKSMNLKNYRNLLSSFFFYLAIILFNSSFLISNCLCQWVQVSNGMGNVDIYSLAANANYLFAGTSFYGVYLSTNNGTNWTHSSLNVQTVWSLAVNGNYVFAGTLTGPPPIATILYLSTNNGTNWTQTSLNNRYVKALAINGSNIFAGTSSYGVYLSTNNGATWTPTSLNAKEVHALAISGNNVLGGGYSGAYLSTNNGATWTLTLTNENVLSLAANGNEFFAGTWLDGVYLSTNNGATWTHTSLNYRDVWSLAADGSNAFAGAFSNTTGLGIYVSNDNGASWTQRNEGLGDLRVNALCISNNYIFAGTYSSAYRRPLSELTGFETISEQVPSHFALEQNYPNPFNPTTKFKIQIAKLNKVTVVIYNILGREVESLLNEELKPGSYEIEWNASDYPSGTYFYKLIAGDFIETKKMILLK